jgi:hypothetical protein
MAASIPAFLQYETDERGHVRNPHQSTLLGFHGSESLVWRGRVSVPVFWATLFSRDELTATGATTDSHAAIERLGRRRTSWQAKASPLIIRGYQRFVDWVASVAGGPIVLDVTGLDAWRHAPLRDALGCLIAFLDGEGEDPGPLPFGADDVVQWVKTRKGPQFQTRVADLRWPDEAPLFDVRCTELADHTVGVPPFRKGPWPERRCVEDLSAVLSPELDAAIKERSTLVQLAIKSNPAGGKPPSSLGNRDAIGRIRDHSRQMCAEFQRAADCLIESAPRFAETHRVLNDAPLWREMLRECERWRSAMETALIEQEKAVDAAMRTAIDAPPDAARELDVDDFPSGDEPF